MTLPILSGSGLRISYGIETTPKFILLDAAGIVRGCYLGWGDETPREIAQELKTWLSFPGGQHSLGLRTDCRSAGFSPFFGVKWRQNGLKPALRAVFQPPLRSVRNPGQVHDWQSTLPGRYSRPMVWARSGETAGPHLDLAAPRPIG